MRANDNSDNTEPLAQARVFAPLFKNHNTSHAQQTGRQYSEHPAFVRAYRATRGAVLRPLALGLVAELRYTPYMICVYRLCLVGLTSLASGAPAPPRPSSLLKGFFCLSSM